MTEKCDHCGKEIDNRNDILTLTDKGVAYKKQLEEDLSKTERGRAYLDKARRMRMCPDCNCLLLISYKEEAEELITCPECKHIFINKKVRKEEQSKEACGKCLI
jgi:DNA-directed RNA polymerase subunit M/transcription elongation factor TFIIS